MSALRLLRTLVPALLGTGLLLCMGVDSGTAQPLTVQPRQDLSFGPLLGGLAEQVRPTDAARSGQFRIRGQNRSVEITLLLPDALVGPGGARIPLSFGPGDLEYAESGNNGARQALDPSRPITLTLGGPPPWHWIYLGGTALPPARTALGSYSGDVILTVSDLSN